MEVDIELSKVINDLPQRLASDISINEQLIYMNTIANKFGLLGAAAYIELKRVVMFQSIKYNTVEPSEHDRDAT